MCGIAGIWNSRPGFDAEAAVAAMLDSMQHRGPDGRGTLAFEGGTAGMVRLALLDLSPRGMQPIWSADRRVAVLFNGEIYNFRAERDRLCRSGAHFQTGTDTEVILQLYLENREEFVDRLRGMFAIAVFDWRGTSTQGLPVLTLVRGPLGIKPLYIAAPDNDPHAVAFSSEVRGLLAGGVVARRVDPEGLADFLACGFILQPRTIISGVRMLESGWLERYAPGEAVYRRQFWHTPPYQPREETLDEAAARLREVLEESIALHAFADAPVGAFLSGGVDSTGIVGLMRKHVSDLRTYTLAYPDAPQRDESEYAIETAARFDCRNTVVEVRGSEMPEHLPAFARAMDQPSADGLNTWLVSRAAAHDVKAVLSGIGGDEWFSGYPVTRRMAYYAVHPLGRAKALAGNVAAMLTDLLPEGNIRQRAYNLATRRSSLSTWLHGHSVFRYDQARRMIGRPADDSTQIHQFEEQLAKLRADFARETTFGLACLLDFGFYMGSQLLRDADAMSMSHSLELRTPYVDVDVVKFSRSCKDEYKLRYNGGLDGHYSHSGAKRVLIHALRDVLPADMAQRPKRGFVLPVVQWMRGELRPLLMETCNLDTIRRRGLIDPAMVAPLMRGTEAISANLYPRLWTLMLLELWCRATLDVPVRLPGREPMRQRRMAGTLSNHEADLLPSRLPRRKGTALELAAPETHAAPGASGGKVLVLGDGMTYFLSVIRSLGRKRIEVHTGWCSADCAALRSRYVAVRHDLPLPDLDGTWKPALLNLLRREQFDLVIPTNEQSTRPLQEHRDELAAAGSIYLLNDRAFDVLFDKWKSLELARSVGMFVPRSELAADLQSCCRLAASFGWPLVLKPLSSFAADDLVQRRGVVKAYNDAELDAGARRLLAKGPVLVQECFVGTGIGVELLAREGKVLADFQHERVHLPPRGGASTYRKSVPLSADLVEASRRLVAALNYTGVLMVEFLVDSDTRQWRFVETNARFWGSLPLAVAAGVDFPYYLYQMLVEGAQQFPRGYRSNLYCRNLTADLYWAHDNLRTDRRDPTLMTVSPARMVREWANLLLLRERFDGFAGDDPWPGVAEVAQFARRNTVKFARRAKEQVVRTILRVPAVRRRAASRARTALREANSVLFVCLGNICRSPLAEHYARRTLPATTEVRSSGLYPRPNRPSPEAAIEAARELGIDLSSHRADVLSEETVARFDAIFSFDESVHQEIRRRFPRRRKLHRFALLGEAGDAIEIPDPFGGSLDRFRAVYRRIAAVLEIKQ